ncbi:MAG: hypothetical protein LBV41_01180, partial [Cytophagaceae bacterium]|nr:hypothetical protein [Cytophagaceae bacterium]
CEEGAYTSEELVYYDRYWDSVRIEKSFMESGRREGLAEGLAEGRAEGKAEGLAEGRTEKSTEIAAKMLQKGMAVEDIAEITGLSKHQIEELKEHIK